MITTGIIRLYLPHHSCCQPQPLNVEFSSFLQVSCCWLCATVKNKNKNDEDFANQEKQNKTRATRGKFLLKNANLNDHRMKVFQHHYKTRKKVSFINKSLFTNSTQTCSMCTTKWSLAIPLFENGGKLVPQCPPQ